MIYRSLYFQNAGEASIANLDQVRYSDGHTPTADLRLKLQKVWETQVMYYCISLLCRSCAVHKRFLYQTVGTHKLVSVLYCIICSRTVLFISCGMRHFLGCQTIAISWHVDPSVLLCGVVFSLENFACHLPTE